MDPAALDPHTPAWLTWTRAPGAETCMDARELEAQVEAVVGHAAFVHGTPGGAAVVGSVAPEPGGWISVIEARRGGELALRRTLRIASPDCRRLDEGVVLVIALVLDSSETEAAPLQIASPRTPMAVSIGADLGVSWGILPGIAVGFGLDATVRVGAFWPVSLWANGWPASRAMTAGAGGGLEAWTIGVGLCPAVVSGETGALFVCLGATAGAIDSTGVGLDVTRSETHPYVDGELRLGGSIRLVGPLFAGADFGAAIPFARYAYHYTESDGLREYAFRTAPIAGIGHARIELRVP